ncbi:diacylglycerol/lipid kinase family protein [Occultella gossypii]|uniref:diacylglycerol/lipid kinase family protein n=1 Tax=Occultella gossypii TaxID=2800820 RepID=UPI0027DFFE31|nr:diacylglycerol kinase family protein [Occultella gossypii]
MSRRDAHPVVAPRVSDEGATTAARRAVVIVNPTNVDLARLRTAVAAAQEQYGWLPTVWLETTIDDAGQLAAGRAVAHDPAVVIVAGGDGTIRAVTEELHSTGIPIAVVPAGTGNLLARNLGLMRDTETAVRTAFTGATRPIDVGLVSLEHDDGSTSSHAFLVMTGVGLDARMATDTSSALKRRIGWLAYVDPISRSVLGNQRFLIHYRVDGQREQSIRAHTVIVGNCGTLTGGMVLLPDAKADDGLLDVVLFRPIGFWQWTRVATRLGVGGILHRSRNGRAVLRATPDLRVLPYVRARTLTARFDPPQSIQLDGDGFGRVVAVTVTLRPRAIGIQVPSA